MKMPKINTVFINGVEAHEVYDIENDEYSVWYSGDGGPIISDKSKTEARRKFAEAWKLCDAVRKLAHFKLHGKFPEQ